ncbi:MAG TPA: type II secretion system protein [Thermoanaerobaculia bacterium]|jgi:type IV pilus assembly protein PilA|nr:type II secretion system protein [Thermoanaerobaculia bacterium]
MRQRQADSNSQQKGFTLIELLIVVALIAILSTLVLPSVAHYRHLAAVGAAQATAHCLETGFTNFNPQSSDPVERYPFGISDQASFVNAANQVGCKMSSTTSRQPVSWREICHATVLCPDGNVVNVLCPLSPDFVCAGGPPVEVSYALTLGVPGYGDTIDISSNKAMEVHTSPIP